MFGLPVADNLLQNIKRMLTLKYPHPGFLDIKVDHSSPGKDIKIIGMKHKEIRVEVGMIIDKAKTYNFPPEWEDTDQLLSGSQLCIMKNIQRGTPEWNKIEMNFKLTMNPANVEKIERIQNRKLWRVFQNEAEDVVNKYGGGIPNANIADMYHGTRNTPPDAIFKSEEGFDMRYSNAGMWGHANYFAKNASYSNSYAHTTASGSKQMFVAKVIIGKPAVLNPTGTLKMPPMIPGTNPSIPYDSVQGNTGGSDVIMVYSNKKAYPQYLLTYR